MELFVYITTIINKINFTTKDINGKYDESHWTTLSCRQEWHI